MDIWIVSSFGPYEQWCLDMFSFLQGRFLGVELLGLIVRSPHSHQYLVLSVFLIIVSHVDVKWYLTVALVSISWITNDAEHLFMCLAAICISCLVTCQFKNFKLVCVLFYYCVVRVFSILDISFLSSVWYNTWVFYLSHIGTEDWGKGEGQLIVRIINVCYLHVVSWTPGYMFRRDYLNHFLIA